MLESAAPDADLPIRKHHIVGGKYDVECRPAGRRVRRRSDLHDHVRARGEIVWAQERVDLCPVAIVELELHTVAPKVLVEIIHPHADVLDAGIGRADACV